MQGDQSVQIHGHAQWTLQRQTCQPEHCPNETEHFSASFPGRFDLIAFRSCLSKLAEYSPLIALPF